MNGEQASQLANLQLLPCPGIDLSDYDSPMPHLQTDSNHVNNSNVMGFSDFLLELDQILEDLPKCQSPSPKKTNKIMYKKMMAQSVKQKTSKDTKADHSCTICLEEIKKNCLVPRIRCKHNFHINCLRKWMDKNECCPLCRRNVR